MMTPKSRSCAKCGVEKPLEEFSRQKKRGKFGRRAHCKVCIAEYRMKNRERLAEYKREYREANRDRLAEKQRRYAEANPEKGAEHNAKRRAAKINRTPAWADLEHIKQFYEARQAISEATGREYHVDHMTPLQGKTVSGLHVPGNLQIIPAERNMSKSNTF